MFRKPQRPAHAVTQPFNDGMVRICRVTNAGGSGKLPEPVLAEKVILPYEERRLGIRRYYDAKENMAEVERVIRVPDPGTVVVNDLHYNISGPVNSQDRAVTEDGNQYAIELVQAVPDVFPKCLDITLRRVELRLEVHSR